MRKFIIGILSLLIVLSLVACFKRTPSTPEQLIPGKATVTDVKQWCNDNGFEILTYEDFNDFLPYKDFNEHPRKTKGNECEIKAFKGSIKNICFGFTMLQDFQSLWDNDYSDGFMYFSSDAFYDDTLREIRIQYVFDDESAYKKGYDAITKEVELLNETYKDIMQAVVTTEDKSGSNIGKYHQVLYIYMESVELFKNKYNNYINE